MSSRLARSASMSPWMISRCVRLSVSSEMPASCFDALEIGAAVLLLALVLLLQLFGARGLELVVERLDLALQRAHGVDRLVDLVEQALLFGVGVLQLADDAVDVDLLAAHQPAALALVAILGLGVLAVRVVHAGGELGGLLLVLDQLVDARDGRLHAGLEDLFGELFLVEGDHFLDVAHAALEVFAEGDDLADDDRASARWPSSRASARARCAWRFRLRPRG